MQNWEKRFRAGRVGLPSWARNAPERAVVAATVDGVVELHSWTTGGELQRLTARREGTSHGTIEPGGENIWWFDDTDGDEHGVWRRQPFGSGPGEQARAATDLPASYPAGLALASTPGGVLAAVGRAHDDGTEIHLAMDGAPARLVYRHRESASVGALSQDGDLLAVSHSERGDSRHPALRVLRTSDGSTLAELDDGPGLGLHALGFAPGRGSTGLLALHERHGHGALLVWDVATGAVHELVLDVASGVSGEVADAEWSQDAAVLLVALDHAARTLLWHVDPHSGAAEPVGPREGTVLAATTRPDGDHWFLWSSAAEPAAVHSLRASHPLLVAPGQRAPGSVPVTDLWVEGPGGPVHALLRLPEGPSGPVPLVVEVHGGPTHHDSDAFRAYAAAWVDHGYAVVQVNYRGSTGYGSAWRDALEAAVGHTELADVVAVRDHLVATGVADADAVVLAGASWGGYLTLLGLGVHPDRWTLGIASVPVADYVAAYDDEMEGLKAFDRSLFGGSPTDVPEAYRRASPITYVRHVTAPVLVLAGENDPRCPIRQIENYLAVLAERGAPHEVYRYDAGHGSLVDDERVRQMRVEIDFARRHLRRRQA